MRGKKKKRIPRLAFKGAALRRFGVEFAFALFFLFFLWNGNSTFRKVRGFVVYSEGGSEPLV